jgi:16S rRNA (adenine1518-N6/adenine1519-N6)-dimethyltransferase
VDSVVVRIERIPPPDVDRERLFAVVRAAFGQRRKTMRQALSAAQIPPEDAAAALAAAGLPPGARAEEVDLAGFVALTRALR